MGPLIISHGESSLSDVEAMLRMLCFGEDPETIMTSGVMGLCPLSTDRRSTLMIFLHCEAICVPIS